MPTKPVGMFMGDSMLPLPDSIVAKIRKLEFVDMSELRPESWLLDEEADEKSVAALFKTKKKPVTDILIWVQCFHHMLPCLHNRSLPYPPIYGLLGNHCPMPS